jgi:ATP synthase protein I
LLGQTALSIGLATVLALTHGRVAAVSCLLGGLVAVIPNAFLAARLLRPSAGADARALLRAAWIGEIGKIAITIVLFAAIFIAVRPLSALAVFGGFVAAQLVVFAALGLGGGDMNDDEAVTKN